MKSMYLNCAKSFILLLLFIISLSQNKDNYINMTINEYEHIKILSCSEEPSNVLVNGNNKYFIEKLDSYYYVYVYSNSSEKKENIVI